MATFTSNSMPMMDGIDMTTIEEEDVDAKKTTIQNRSNNTSLLNDNNNINSNDKKKKLIDALHEAQLKLTNGEGYLNKECYPIPSASSSTNSIANDNNVNITTTTTTNNNNNESNINIQSFFNNINKPLQETKMRRRLEHEYDVAIARRDMIKARTQLSKCNMDEEEEIYRKVLGLLYEKQVNDEIANNAEAKFQIKMLQYECDKMELITAETSIETARIRLENARTLEIKSKQRLVQKMDKITSIVKSFSHIMCSNPRTFFFICNCNLYGLMEIYSKILLQRRKRWKIYPDEKWFQFKDGSKQQVYCPLANVTVDFCDQSTYTLTNPIINGNIYFSSKVHMGQILIQAETKLIPPTFIIKNNKIINGTGLLLHHKAKDKEALAEEENESDNDLHINNILHKLAQEYMPIWFLKDSRYDYSRGISMLKYPWEYKKEIEQQNNKTASNNDGNHNNNNNNNNISYVLQPHILDPLLYDNKYKFHIRQYILIHKPSRHLFKTSGVDDNIIKSMDDFNLYIYNEGWLDICTKEFTGKLNLNEKHEDINDDNSNNNICDQSNISRDRTLKWKDWKYYEKSFPILLNATRSIVNIIKIKLDSLDEENDNEAKERQKLQNQFELFGCDYVFNNNFQPYLLEVNSGPVCKETEFEMIERMLNIVLPFGMNDDTEEEDDDDKIEQEKELRNINNKWVKVEM